MGHCDKVTFIEQLKAQVGEFIVIYIKSGADCCKHRGVLCNIEEDFLVLIGDGIKTEIPLKAIVAVKKKISGGKNNKDDCYDGC